MFSRVSLLSTLLISILLSTSGTPAHASAAETYERQAVQATNAARDARDLPALRTDNCLSRFANRQARRMADEQVMFHQDLHPILRACGLRSVAENVAYGYSTGRSVVTDGWMESPGHRANILTGAHRIVAVGSVMDEDGRWWTAQVLGRR